MRRFRLSPEAVRELGSLADWIERQAGSSIVAGRVVSDIEAAIGQIAMSPVQLGVSADSQAPGLGLRRYPHKNSVLYRRYPDDQTLEIFTILWGGRDRSRYFEVLTRKARR